MSSKSQRFLDCFTANMKVLRWFETSLTSKPHSAPHDMPVYLTLQPYRCENLKYSSVFITLFRLMITWDWVPWNCGTRGTTAPFPANGNVVLMEWQPPGESRGQKEQVPEKAVSLATLLTTDLLWTVLESKPGLRDESARPNHLGVPR